MPDQNWQFELEEYIKQGEPNRAEKSEAWQTAIGLQAVDGLNTSAYLLDTAKDHIEGKITIDEAQQRIHSYYEQRTTRTEIENETKEADIVSARIAKLLGEKAFQFSPAEWLSIHRRLFEGVFSHAGQIRQYNITKKEWVLNGDTVIYADWNSIKDTLDYDFANEKQFSYEGLSVDAAVKHLAKFASDIWQIHPFGEGNTRATAVFMIKYMKTFGFRVNNDAFEKNSWYFRNALVRANYTNLQKGINLLQRQERSPQVKIVLWSGKRKMAVMKIPNMHSLTPSLKDCSKKIACWILSKTLSAFQTRVSRASKFLPDTISILR